MVKVPSERIVVFEVYVFPVGPVRTPVMVVFGTPLPKTSIVSPGRYTAWLVCAVNGYEPDNITEPELWEDDTIMIGCEAVWSPEIIFISKFPGATVLESGRPIVNLPDESD